MRQLIIFPELVEDLLLLHRARRALLLKLADAALHVEHIFVEFAAAAVALAALGLQRKLHAGKLFERRALFRHFAAQCGDLFFMHADLAPRLLACRFVLLNERPSALLVALHLGAQALQARKRLFRGLALGGKARKRTLAPGDLIAEARGGAQQLRLPGETLLSLRAQRGGLALLLRCKRFLFFHGALHLAAAAGDGIALGIQCFQPLAQRGKQQIIVIFVALQLEHGVLRRALLPLRDLQLVSRLG